MRLELDLVDEVRAMTEQRLAWYQDLMAKHYNSKVRHRDFQVRDLVLRKVIGATKDISQGKLGPNWEGPYRIASWHRKGTYHLEIVDGQKLHQPQNEHRVPKKVLPADNNKDNNTPHSQFITFQLKFYFLQFLLRERCSTKPPSAPSRTTP